MNPNQIESAKERINFLSRTMLAYIAGVYLLAGAAGNYLMDWFVQGVWGIIPTFTVAGAIILSLEVIRLQWKIDRLITRIGETS